MMLVLDVQIETNGYGSNKRNLSIEANMEFEPTIIGFSYTYIVVDCLYLESQNTINIWGFDNIDGTSLNVITPVQLCGNVVH